MTRSRFDQEVDASIARRQREKARLNSTCSECGGKWWPPRKGYWHEFTCSQFALNKKRYSRKEQDRHARVLREEEVAFPCGCIGYHGWDCLDNPYRASDEPGGFDY